MDYHPLPKTTINTLKKIIKAYSMYEAGPANSLMLSDFSNIARNEIAGNSIFLASIGILEETNKSFYKITPIGQRLGKLLTTNLDKNETEVIKIWGQLIDNSPFFKEILNWLKLADANSGRILKDDLKKMIISLSKYKDKGTKIASAEYAPTTIRILETAKIILASDNKSFRLLHQAEKATNFISQELINDLRSLKIKKFDLTRLISYCEQINENYARGYYEAVAFLTRALMDHVPPIFGKANFESIGSQVSQQNTQKTSSFKKSCDKLSSTLKHIVDDLIHKQITSGVSRLVKEEIDFSQDINTFLRRTLDELQKLQKNNE